MNLMISSYFESDSSVVVVIITTSVTCMGSGPGKIQKWSSGPYFKTGDSTWSNSSSVWYYPFLFFCTSDEQMRNSSSKESGT